MEKADLFVLACGRNNFLAAALMRGGFGSVPATKLTIEVHYTTGALPSRPGSRANSNFLICFPKPPEIALGLLTPIETNG